MFQLKKLFAGKNKDKAQPQGKFYLELKETDAPKTDVSVAETAAVVVGAPQTEPVPETPAADVSVVEGEPTERMAQEPDKKKDKKAADKKSKAVKGKGAKEPAKAAPVAPPAPPTPEELIIEAVKGTSNGKVESKEVLFAASSTIGSTLSRRRPGPSLNLFKDMARQAKVPTSKR